MVTDLRGAFAVTYTSVSRIVSRRKTIEPAFRFAVQTSERSPSGGVYAGASVLWTLPGTLLDPIEPKPGDTVTDPAGTVWTVLATDTHHLTRMWNLTCLALSIAHRLRRRVSIWLAARRSDAAGGSVTTHPAASETNIAASIQETSAAPDTARGKRGRRRQYEIRLATQHLLTEGDQVRDEDGVIYEVTGYSAPDRLDELALVTAEVNVP